MLDLTFGEVGVQQLHSRHPLVLTDEYPCVPATYNCFALSS